MRHPKRHSIELIAVFAAIAAISPPNAYAKCGKERWSIKIGTDAGAKSIDLNSPKDETIEGVRNLTRPATVDANTTRVTGVETTVYRISGRIKQFKRETDDSDYHVVLADDSGRTIIIEIPSPACTAGSPWQSVMAGVRTEFDEQIGPATTQFKMVDVPVTVTGVGFFDVDHGAPGQTGHAPNNFEMHPVLSLELEETATPPLAPPNPPAAETAKQPNTGGLTPTTLFWLIAGLMTVLYGVFLVGVWVNLHDPAKPWSLAGALSEDDKPSSSRLIAFAGLLVLMVIYIGVSYVVVWRLLNNQGLPDVNGFLLTGLTLFAPYAANQFKALVLGAASGGASPGTGSKPGAPPAGGGTAAAPSSPKIFSVTPNTVSGGASTSLTVAGSGFDPKATIVVTTPTGPLTPVANVTATQAQFPVLMPAAGATPYVAVVNLTNPDGGHATGSFQVT